jgi:hypothetical protein
VLRRYEIADDFVRVVLPEEWFDSKPNHGRWFAVSPLLGGVELKYQSPNWRLCSRLAYYENARCSVAGVSPVLAAEYWAWQEQWGVFIRKVAASAHVQGHILALAPVHIESIAIARLEHARTIVRSVVAAEACGQALEALDGDA